MRWAHEEFGATKLGDIRNTRRLVAMAIGAARHPSGKVSVVFKRAADREGAYDFIENEKVNADRLIDSMGCAAAARAGGSAFAFVAIDSSSLSVTNDGRKGFGRVGPLNTRVHGLMVMNAYAVSEEGIPLGLVDQRYWNRGPTQKLTRAERTKRDLRRPFEDKESAYFIHVATEASKRLAAQDVQSWVVIDRGGDTRDVLLGLQELGCHFTVRASWNRELHGSEEAKLQDALDAAKSLGDYKIEIGRSGRRAARTATVEVRTVKVTLRFRARALQEESVLGLYAVRVREMGAGEDRVEWTLYTNVPVVDTDDAAKILNSYRTRWRVEEFHRTWKKGDCNVEDAQLGSVDALKKWAIVLSAVAARIEALKYLAREQSEAPASTALSAAEIEALKLERLDRAQSVKRHSADARNKRAKAAPLPEMPTIGEATKWIAEMGGWTGKSNGDPGSTTIARGLERLGLLVEGIALARRMKQLRLST